MRMFLLGTVSLATICKVRHSPGEAGRSVCLHDKNFPAFALPGRDEKRPGKHYYHIRINIRDIHAWRHPI